MDAALSPLRASGMRILNYLDDWLILAQSRDTLLSHIDSLLIHMESLGLCVNMQKSILAPSQFITYLGLCLDSVEMRARLSRERAAAMLSFLRHFREGSSVHSEAAGTQGVSFGSMSSGLITHTPVAAMAEISSPQDSVDCGTFEYRGHLRLHRSSDAVAQPRSLQPGSSPGLGSVAQDIQDIIKILPLVLYKIRKERASVLLIAPNWSNQPWIPDLTELLVAPPWPIPIRKDMLSQADGSVWHSNPELWSLHVWLLQGYQRS